MSSAQIAGRVNRYHTWPMIRKPTVAEHACRVATLYVELWGLPRAEVLYYCLRHDDGELTAGDTPFYAKRGLPSLKESVDLAESMGRLALGVRLPELTSEERRRFKMADFLEMWECALVEANMGNRYAIIVMRNLHPAIRVLAAEMGVETRVSDWINGNLPEGAERWHDV